jgi:chromosome segregation ATPase
MLAKVKSLTQTVNSVSQRLDEAEIEFEEANAMNENLEVEISALNDLTTRLKIKLGKAQVTCNTAAIF